jgi:4-hydroxy-3-methylbut-2-enyl diphosphate reductase IspH
MQVVLLKKDGRCLWLERKVLTSLLPMAIKAATNPFAKRLYFVVDWISSDRGRVGVDLKWFRSLGVPSVASCRDLPTTVEYQVVNTGYDANVAEERLLRTNGVEILDLPCPFIRVLRRHFETADPSYQYVFICDANHLLVRNFQAVFPADMILAQVDNYPARIHASQNGKPLRIVPYVTLMPRLGKEVLAFVRGRYPGLPHDGIDTGCMWVRSKASPIIEIESMSAEDLRGIHIALLIGSANSSNQSLLSLWDTLAAKGLRVVQIGSLWDLIRFERQHRDARVLVVRSPIPNNAEGPILAYLGHGLVRALWTTLSQSHLCRRASAFVYGGVRRAKFTVFRACAREEAREMGLLKQERPVVWMKRR